MRRIVTTSLLVSLALLLGLVGACTSTPAPTTTPAAVAPPGPKPVTTAAPAATPTATAPAGPTGELRVALITFGAAGFDPVIDLPPNMIAPIFDFMFTLDEKNVLSPGVVEKWETAPDGLSWTYYIRKGIKFSNGEDLNAADVKFTIERYAGKDAFYSQTRNAVDRVEMVDDYTVRIHTKGVQPFLPYYQTSLPPQQGLVQPKDYIDQRGVEYFRKNPVGSGPFKLVRFAPGDVVEYEAVDKHWARTPAFKKLQLILMPEETTRIAALKTGTIDVADIGLNNVIDLESAGFKTIASDRVSTAIMIHGTYHPAAKGMPTADVRVRQALSLAINRDEINKTIFAGKAGPALPSRVAPAAADIDVARWTKWSADNYRYDPAKAKQLLASAGYPQGFTLTLYAVSERGAPYQSNLAQILQGYWRAIGVNAQIVSMEVLAFDAMRKAPDPKIIGGISIRGAGSNPLTTNPLRQGLANAGGGHRLYATSTNDSAFPEVDTWFDQADKEPDAVKRGRLLDQIIEKTADTYVVIQLGTVPSLYAYNPRRVEFPPVIQASKGFGIIANLTRLGTR